MKLFSLIDGNHMLYSVMGSTWVHIMNLILTIDIKIISSHLVHLIVGKPSEIKHRREREREREQMSLVSMNFIIEGQSRYKLVGNVRGGIFPVRSRN